MKHIALTCLIYPLLLRVALRNFPDSASCLSAFPLVLPQLSNRLIDYPDSLGLTSRSLFKCHERCFLSLGIRLSALGCVREHDCGWKSVKVSMTDSILSALFCNSREIWIAHIFQHTVIPYTVILIKRKERLCRCSVEWTFANPTSWGSWGVERCVTSAAQSMSHLPNRIFCSEVFDRSWWIKWRKSKEQSFGRPMPHRKSIVVIKFINTNFR